MSAPSSPDGSTTPETAREVLPPLGPVISAARPRPGLGVWIRDLIVSLAISAFIIVFIYQPVKVECTTMMQSLDDQERIFVTKFVYRLMPTEFRDFRVFRLPPRPLKMHLKPRIRMARH